MEKVCDVAKLRKLGARLRNGREMLGMSLRHVVENTPNLGFNFSNLAKLERGEIPRPPISTLILLANLYELDTDELILLAEKIPPDVYWKIVNNPYLIKRIRAIKS